MGKPEAAVISNIDQMEHLGGEQHSQYEGNLSAHRSMRDYRNSPWMNVPSSMVHEELEIFFFFIYGLGNNNNNKILN